MNEEQKLEMARVEQVMDTLAEHFDTVQIFCTRNIGEADGNTINIGMGTGNWFARYGQIAYWLEKQNEQARIDTRKANEDAA